jgi:hypothetical protein
MGNAEDGPFRGLGASQLRGSERQCNIDYLTPRTYITIISAMKEALASGESAKIKPRVSKEVGHFRAALHPDGIQKLPESKLEGRS